MLQKTLPLPIVSSDMEKPRLSAEGCKEIPRNTSGWFAPERLLGCLEKTFVQTTVRCMDSNRHEQDRYCAPTRPCNNYLRGHFGILGMEERQSNVTTLAIRNVLVCAILYYPNQRSECVKYDADFISQPIKRQLHKGAHNHRSSDDLIAADFSVKWDGGSWCIKQSAAPLLVSRQANSALESRQFTSDASPALVAAASSIHSLCQIRSSGRYGAWTPIELFLSSHLLHSSHLQI